MQPTQMAAQMTEEQAIQQIKLRKANLTEVLVLKQAENEAVSGMIHSLQTTLDDLTQVFPAPVVASYLAMMQCRLNASNYEIAAITRELKQADQLLAQAASPILVPGRGSVMGGGGIRQF